MYNLTDYTEFQLRILSAVMVSEMQAINTLLSIAKTYLPEGEIYNDVTRRDAEKLAVIREHHVHILSALAMVKDRNLIAAS